jgi:hypothetical protein
MTECKDQSWLFQDLGSRKVEVDFGGGYPSSDGGGLILRELERHNGLLRDLSGCFVDYRTSVILNIAFKSFLVSGSMVWCWATKTSMIMTICGATRSMD